MIRKIIRIDENKCNGCGLCAKACHEGAIVVAGGKAKLLREDYCDGLGDCLPTCPVNAITFEEREAPAYDEAAVKAAQEEKAAQAEKDSLPCGCLGTAAKFIRRMGARDGEKGGTPMTSRLSQWPVQIKLVAVNASYFQKADLLVAADCTAFAYGDFHNAFLKNRVCVIGCPKLDMTDYAEKLTAVIAANDIKSITVVRMEVPCCGGIENAVKDALRRSGKYIPLQVVTVTIDGSLKD